MKTVNVRELRAAIPTLREELAREQELVLVSHGEAVARILPMPKKRQVPSLAEHRSRMRMLPMPIEALIREERDRR
jgi:antitoxin (DNA-binding transcriptional repressor) of toxin-antitoxin stability system